MKNEDTPKKLIMEYIIWTDQDYVGGPLREEDVFKWDCVGMSVGMIVAEDDHRVCLAMEHFGHAETFRHIVRIPKQCILARSHLAKVPVVETLEEVATMYPKK